ncbi:MAG: xanthine dehydrogenase family protein molybdopterin-binding subunit [Anaerolineaceae bacterium]|nr:xanthine dehydrogenase family protein molybdopterin-binding subunit [Anaerolineaceae bacterium]
MAVDLKVVGNSEPRKDAIKKTSGAAAYTADILLPDTRFGVLVRSPHHHARIVAIDTTAALARTGVAAVLTAQDVPGDKTFGSLVQDQPVLAFDEVRHVGEPVALVIAESKDAARRAAECVRIEFQPLPAVFDPLEALKPGAPQVHPGGNLLANYDVSCGDVKRGFEEAEVILEEDFSVQRVSPGYMEPENSLARLNQDGTVTVWVSSQSPFVDQKTISDVLGIPVERVQVIGAVVGGAFGGKEDSSIAVLAALAAWATHGAVQIANTRHESFVAHPKRHPAKFHIKLGARRDGTLVALHTLVHMDTGAYASYGPAVGQLLTEVAPGAYRIPNTRVETRVVYTHSPYSGAMRGFGSPQAHFAMESALDMLANRLGIDPLELRRKNILQPGDALFTQVVVDETAASLPLCLKAAEEARRRMQQEPSTPGKRSGVGMALAMQSMGLGAKVLDDSTHRLEWLPDGRVLIHLGAPDLGQGLATVSEQMVAEALEIPYEQVITAALDTLNTPNGGVTCGSRLTYLAGKALLAASEKLKKALLENASRLLQVPEDQLTYQGGSVILPDGQHYAATEFSSRAADLGSPLQAEATATFPYPEETTPQHLPIGMPHVKFAFAAQIVRVEVDVQLGTVEVKEVVAVHDVGQAINRAAVEGQIEGGVSMGIGYALYEDMALKPNQSWVDSFSEYLLPTALDVPATLEIQILEIPEASGPFGAKGIAEIALVPTAPAIANAVFDAVKVRVRDLPITPEKIVQIESQVK